jgi:hypothetical protein
MICRAFSLLNSSFVAMIGYNPKLHDLWQHANSAMLAMLPKGS